MESRQVTGFLCKGLYIYRALYRVHVYLRMILSSQLNRFAKLGYYSVVASAT